MGLVRLGIAELEKSRLGWWRALCSKRDKTRKDLQVDHHGSATTSSADSVSTMPCISEISYEVIVPFCGIPSLWP